jgi:hypothetical protein
MPDDKPTSQVMSEGVVKMGLLASFYRSVPPIPIAPGLVNTFGYLITLTVTEANLSKPGGSGSISMPIHI